MPNCEVSHGGGYEPCSTTLVDEPYPHCSGTCFSCVLEQTPIECPQSNGQCMNSCPVDPTNPGGPGGPGGSTPPTNPPCQEDECNFNSSKPFCQVTINGGTFTASEGIDNVSVWVMANAHRNEAKWANVWVERVNGGVIDFPYASDTQYEWPNPPPYHFYRIMRFQSANSNVSASTDISLPAGEYFVHCDVDTGDDDHCSGKPFCTDVNTDAKYLLESSTFSCTWGSCDNDVPNDSVNDWAYVNVVAPQVTISANVYNDDTATCTGTNAAPNAVANVRIQEGMTLLKSQNVPPTISQTVTGSGLNIPKAYQVSYSILNGNYVRPNCSNSSTTVNVTNANQSVNFYVTQRQDPWFQIFGGDAGARGGITNVLPSPLYEANQRTFMAATVPSRSAGMPVSQGSFSSVPSGQAAGPWTANSSLISAVSSSKYADFMRTFEMGTPDPDWSGNYTLTDSYLDNNIPSGGKQAYYYSGGETLYINALIVQGCFCKSCRCSSGTG